MAAEYKTPKLQLSSTTSNQQAEKNGATLDDIEDKLSIFDTQLAIYEPLAAIPMFSQYLAPVMNQIKENQAALQLVSDNFEAFSGGDDLISKYDRIDIEEAAEEDDNASDFSEEDLDVLYDMHGITPPPEEFSYSAMDFDERINYDSDDNNIDFDDDVSNDNILVRDRGGDDTYTVTEDTEDANIVFTKLDDGDALSLEGEWSIQQIEDVDDGDPYVLYTNEDTGTNIFVLGEIDEVEDLVTVETEVTADAA